MSSSYFILRMLRKKSKKLESSSRTQQKHVSRSSSFQSNNKLYTDQDNKCRICLKVGRIPIFAAQQAFNISDAIRSIGGVDIQENDTYPKTMCKKCYSLLNGAVRFRKSAQESDIILRQITSIKVDSPRSHDEADIPINVNITEPNSKIYRCKTCQIQFKTHDKYKAHKNSKKHKNVRIQCKICNRLLTPTLYEKHLARHQSASHLVCDVCGKLYRKDNLIRHLQLHSNELPFQCKICPYRGRFMESLKIHMRTHSGDRPFSCDKCELQFITRSNLNRHLLTHKKEKPFKCIECNRGFYIKRDLDVHIKADHTGIKEFCCMTCGNKYGSKKAVMRHELRVHNRDKMAKGRMPLYLQAEYKKNYEMNQT